MFNSDKSVRELITELQTEVDIAIDIPESTYLTWLTSLEHLIYTEIIKEQGVVIVTNPTDPINLDTLDIPEDEEKVRFEDIHSVYADDVQLIKSTLASGSLFPDTFYKENNNLCFNTHYQTMELRIIYLVRPKAKTMDSYVMFPIEFMELVKSKLRGEAYNLANEEELSAKWINNYNVLLETFKVWCNNRASQFGM